MFSDAAKLATAAVGVGSSSKTASTAVVAGAPVKSQPPSTIPEEVEENKFYMPEIMYEWRDEHYKRRLSVIFNPPAGVTSEDILHSITLDGLQLIIDYRPPVEFTNASRLLAVHSNPDGTIVYSSDSARSVALMEALRKKKRTDPVDKNGSVPWYRMKYNLPFPCATSLHGHKGNKGRLLHDRPRELARTLKIATTLHFELIALEDFKTETHGENNIGFMDLGMFINKMKKEAGYADSDDNDDGKAAKRRRKNGGSDASHIIEDEKGEEGKDEEL